MKNVLISGGSRGIGAACVRKFAQMGDSVCFIYKSSDSAADALAKECGVFAVKADLSNAEETVKAVAAAAELMGGIDVLVANAGVSNVAQICDVDDKTWRNICNINLGSVFTLCREASVYMVKEHSGSIVNIGSIWGAVGASCEAAYSATKAGVRGLTMALAKELAPSGINVNCVEPGFIDTDMNSAFSAEDRKSIVSEIPMNREGTAEEVAELVAFLTGKTAKYITGQCIGIDGGYGR